MAKPLVSEILQGLSDLKGKELHKLRVQYLKDNSYPALRDVLRINFDDDIVSLLPKGIPPYKKDNVPAGMEYTTLHKGFRKFKYFFKGAYSGINQGKRESMFISLLESLHGDEAEMLCLAKDGKLYDAYKGLTLKVVQEAFPGLIKKAPKVAEKKAPAKKTVKKAKKEEE